MKFPVALFSIAVMVIGITVSSEGGINRVLSLDGCEDCVEVPDNDILDFRADDSFTLEAWVLLKNSSCIVLAKRVPEFIQAYALDLTEQYAEIFVRDAGSTKQYVIGTSIVRDRIWHHIAGVRDKSQNKLFLYVDGELEGQLDSITGDLSNHENLYIGQHIYRGGSGFVQGYIDEVRIWNIPRSHEQILSAMNTTLTGQEDGLIAYWSFDDGTANDMTQNRNDGRLLADAEIVEKELPGNFIHKGINLVSIENRIVNPGDQFAVNVYTHIAEELHSFSFDLSFDPSVLKALRIEEGSLLNRGSADSTSWDKPSIDNKKGTIAGIRCARTGKDGVTKEGTLAVVTFEARETGSTDLSIPSIRLLSPKGVDMLASLRRGVVNVYSHGSISGTVYGKVLDWPTVRPILGARVEVSRDGFTFGVSAESGLDGRYRIDGVPAGRFDVTASKYCIIGEYVDGTVSDVNVRQGETSADIDVKIRSSEIVIPRPLEPIHDIMVSAIIAPEEKLEPAKPVVPKAKIFNAGSFDEVNVPVSCEITTADKMVYSSVQIIEKMASFRSQEVSFAEWVPQEEEYEVKVTVKLPGDAIKDNDISSSETRTMTPQEMPDALRGKAQEFCQQKRFDEGKELAKRALEMAERIHGPDNPIIATYLDTLGHISLSQAKYSEAEAFYQRALTIREKKLGSESLDAANSLHNMALLYNRQGKLQEADLLFQRELVIRETILGTESPDLADFLGSIILFYNEGAKYAEAENLAKRALAIHEKIYGTEHLRTASSLDALALIYSDQGKYSEAELLYKRVMAIKEKLGLSDDSDSLDNLAILYELQGKYSEAESLFQRALAIRKKDFGIEHLLVGHSLIDLAIIYQFQGKFSEAESLFQQALEIYEKNCGPEHPYVATSMLYLARIYQYQDKYSEAEPFFKRALAIYERFYGLDHPGTANSLCDLASIYIAQGKYSEAEQLLQRSLTILEKIFGPEHLSAAFPMRKLATLYRYQNKYSEAESIGRRASAIYEKALGPEGSCVTVYLEELAKSEVILNHPKDALSLMQRSLLIDEHTMDNVFSLASEREKFTFLKTVANRFDVLQSLVTQNLAKDQEAVRASLDATLRRKGLVLDALSRERIALLSSSDPKVSEIARQLQKTASSIASMTLAGPGKLSPEAYRNRLSELETEKDQLEEELAHLSGAYAAERQSRQVDADLIARSLEPGSVLVEYVSYKRHNFFANNPEDEWGEQRYLAFVLPAGQNANPVLIDLGDAKTIDDAIHAFHQEAAGAASIIPNIGEAEAERQLTEKGKRVYDLVFVPLKVAIGDSAVLYVSPDGDLNLIPFGVLTDENGQYLVENHQFNYLSSGRDLLRFGQDISAGTEVVVLADPDYNLSRTKVISEPVDISQLVAVNEPAVRSTDFKTMLWYPLPNTSDEAEAILKELPGDKKVYLKDQALEEVVKSLHSPRILHIATHAFFLEEQDKTPWLESQETILDMRATDPSQIPLQKPIPAAPGIENPLLRSGLILAGANRLGQEQGGEDGILTALEISGLSLWGTDLVVLSACETGMGEARIGEGVFGLRRAFQLAGARTLVMSQWDIPDEETVSLMTNFYARLKAGAGKSQALREASLAQMKTRRELNGAAHPFFWGAFVCVGNP